MGSLRCFWSMLLLKTSITGKNGSRTSTLLNENLIHTRSLQTEKPFGEFTLYSIFNAACKPLYHVTFFFNNTQLVFGNRRRLLSFNGDFFFLLHIFIFRWVGVWGLRFRILCFITLHTQDCTALEV